ncbi:Protein SFI1 [Lonchura striata]|uniref:Protein SFI1 n=1 Tax=Lonchura striata TaxID=40157 RepID=A0A218V2T6_9PASE|nr:Protein SFI1 [Lonchura striata domestica]
MYANSKERGASIMLQSLMELGLKGLWQNVLDTRLQRMRTNLSFCQHRVTVLQKYWNRWKSRLEEKEEEQQQALTSMAHAHYRRVLMRQVFDTWLLKACKLQGYRMDEKRYVGHQCEKWRKLMRADLHYQRVLLGKTLAAWKIYQQNIQCILYQVAEKEKQHTRLLLRQVLCTWRENALALLHESEATTRADEHYRRTILSKVLLQWRDTAWLQACHRHLKVTAVVEARKHLDLVHLQSLFLHWKELMRESLMLKAQHHRAAQHHQQHLLQKYLVKWKNYHHQRLRKKVFDAWLRFAKGQQEKKDGTEKVTRVHHTAPLREGVTYALRNTAGIKQLQGQLHTQPQLEVRERLHRYISRTGLLWSLLCVWDDKANSWQCIVTLFFFLYRSEVPFQQTSVNKCPAQTRNLMLTPHVEESTCKCLSQMDNAAHPHPSLTCASLPPWTQDMHRAGQGPELWCPASFMSHMKAGSEEVSVLLKEQLVREWMSVLPPLLVPYVFHSAEGEKKHSSREEAMLERRVEVELRHIQQQMQYYYSRKQELKCCQQQAQILQQWLEMSTQPGAQDGVQGVQEELGELQVRIKTLTKAQLAERHHVQALLARLQEIQLALDL